MDFLSTEQLLGDGSAVVATDMIWVDAPRSNSALVRHSRAGLIPLRIFVDTPGGEGRECRDRDTQLTEMYQRTSTTRAETNLGALKQRKPNPKLRPDNLEGDRVTRLRARIIRIPACNRH